MKLGMPILFEFSTIEENFQLAKELGLDFVELNLNFGYCRKALEDGSIKELVKKYDLETTLHFFDEADFASYQEVVDGYMILLKKYVSLGEGFVSMVNIHNNPGPVSTISGVKHFIYEKEYPEFIERLLTNLNTAKRICEEKGMRFVVENTDIAPSATYMTRVMKDEFEAGFRFNYDIGHDNVCNYIVRDLLRTVPLEFDEFHFHDADGKRCHLSIGEGTMNEKLEEFKTLADANDAYVLLEVKSKEDLEKTVGAFKAL